MESRGAGCSELRMTGRGMLHRGGNQDGAVPRACRPYRAKTKGKIERPYRYVRQDFWRFRNLDELNAQFDHWRTQIANTP